MAASTGGTVVTVAFVAEYDINFVGDGGWSLKTLEVLDVTVANNREREDSRPADCRRGAEGVGSLKL
jgi:hypothetical protein